MNHAKLRLDTFLPFNLSVASYLVSDVIADSYKILFGLKVPEWRLLAVIAEADGLNQQELGLRTRMDKVTVSRAAIALFERNLVTRMPNPLDGRSHLLTLSTAGRTLYDNVVPQALALEAQVFSGLTKNEIDALFNALRKVQATSMRILEARNAGGRVTPRGAVPAGSRFPPTLR